LQNTLNQINNKLKLLFSLNLFRTRQNILEINTESQRHSDNKQ